MLLEEVEVAISQVERMPNIPGAPPTVGAVTPKANKQKNPHGSAVFLLSSMYRANRQRVTQSAIV